MTSNTGAWDRLYAQNCDKQMYGDDKTARMGAEWLKDAATVEDWGCGWAGFSKYLLPTQKYIGIDGSKSPHADVIANLETYKSARPDGIFMRAVIEHDHNWRNVLKNAVESFGKKFCLVIFTPFGEETKAIATHKNFFDGGADLPDISFKKEDITDYFNGLKWTVNYDIPTDTQYKCEHMFYVERI